MFTCGDFAESVQNNAEKRESSVGGLVLTLSMVQVMLAMFLILLDKGIVFIECTSGDAEVDMNFGRSYSYAPLDQNANYFIKPLGILKNYDIYW